MSVNDTLRALSLADSTDRGAGFPSVLDNVDWTRNAGGRYRREKTRMVRCDRVHCPRPLLDHYGDPRSNDWRRAGQAAFLLLIGFLLCWLAFAAGVL